MQTTRNLFLWPVRSLVRKALELWLTPQLAALWPKRRILEVYLNDVEFGPGIFGAEAAATLTLDQAARLAVILPDPMHWSPRPPDPWVTARAALIAHRAGKLGPLLACVR